MVSDLRQMEGIKISNVKELVAMKEFLTKPFLDLKNKQFLSLHPLKNIEDAECDFIISKKVNAYTVHFYISGHGTYRLRNREIIAESGYLLFSPLDHIKEFRTSEDCEGFALIFSETFFGKTTMKSSFLHHTQLFNSIDKIVFFPVEERFEDILNLFQLIIKELGRPYSEIQEQILLNYVFSILLISEELHKYDQVALRVDNDIKILKNFKALYNKELNKRHSLKFFCDKMNLSLNTLERAFKKYENTTPKKWTNKRLVSELQMELNRMDSSISDIAFKFGFSEVTNFTKFFKGQTGITPKQFRARLQL